MFQDADLSAPYDVSLYQNTHRGQVGDIAFYRRVCKGATAVLELGCGWGRVMMPLLEAGHCVTGLDLHPGMIAALQERLATAPEVLRSRAHLVEADMADFSLEQRFDRVLIPYNGLYVLDNEAAQRACLQRAFAHLVEGGELWLDVYQVDEEAMREEADVSDENASEEDANKQSEEDANKQSEESIREEADVSEENASKEDTDGQSEEDREEDGEWGDDAFVERRLSGGMFLLAGGKIVTFAPVASLYEGERCVDILEGRRWEPAEQRLDAFYLYRIEEAGVEQEQVYAIPQRYLHAAQLTAMLRDVGFVIGGCFCDLHKTPWEEGDEMLVIQAIRPRG